jgi:hypothetical protein
VEALSAAGDGVGGSVAWVLGVRLLSAICRNSSVNPSISICISFA